MKWTIKKSGHQELIFQLLDMERENNESPIEHEVTSKLIRKLTQMLFGRILLRLKYVMPDAKHQLMEKKSCARHSMREEEDVGG